MTRGKRQASARVKDNPYADPGLVNLSSDTQTRPTPGMRQAIAEAEVGDEQRGSDPTVLALEERVAEMLGHDAAVFLPSGTMCNQVAIRMHIRPSGDELLLDRSSHLVHAETGGPSVLSGASLSVLAGNGGIFDGAQLEAAIRPPTKRNAPRSRLVCVEQTANLAGGRIWPLSTIREVIGVARAHGLRAHLDGARLLNASVATGIDAADYGSPFDTAWIDFSKGLGAPIGAVLAGPSELIEEAWRYKHMFGGAMRQSGILAAGALYALDHHVARLAVDHDNARRLADGIWALDGITLDPSTVETNIVCFGHADPAALVAALRRHGVIMDAMGPGVVRAVTHLDVGADDVETAVRAVGRALADLA